MRIPRDSSPTAELKRLVDGDSVEPGRDGGSAVELLQPLESFDVGFLCQVRRIVWIPGHANQQSIDLRRRGFEQSALGFAVADATPFDKFSLVHTFLARVGTARPVRTDDLAASEMVTPECQSTNRWPLVKPTRPVGSGDGRLRKDAAGRRALREGARPLCFLDGTWKALRGLRI